MPERPPEQNFIEKINNALERLRILEGKRLLPGEKANPLQGFENGSPLGEVDFLDFGVGIQATLIGDKFVQIRSDVGESEFDATVDASFDVSQPTKRLFKGIGEALTYLNATVGLTSAVLLVRNGTYRETANWSAPANYHLFGARGQSYDGSGGISTGQINWRWNRWRQTTVGCNATLTNIYLEPFTNDGVNSGPGTGYGTSTFIELTLHNTGIVFSTQTPDAAAPYTFCQGLVAENSQLGWTAPNGGSTYNLASQDVQFSNVDLRLAQQLTGNPILNVAGRTLIVKGGRWYGSVGTSGTPQINLPTTFDVEITNYSQWAQAGGGASTSHFVIPPGGKGRLEVNNRNGTSDAPWNVDATAAFTQLLLIGNFGIVRATGAHDSFAWFGHHSGGQWSLAVSGSDIRGPSIVDVTDTLTGTQPHFTFRGFGNNAKIAGGNVSGGFTTYLQLVDSDQGMYVVSANGSATSAPMLPYSMDASSTHNFILWPQLASWPTAGTDAGTNNRVETTPAGTSPGAPIGHVIEDEGIPLTQRANLNFVGAGVTVTDAAPDTVVTIPGAAASEPTYLQVAKWGLL